MSGELVIVLSFLQIYCCFSVVEIPALLLGDQPSIITDVCDDILIGDAVVACLVHSVVFRSCNITAKNYT